MKTDHQTKSLADKKMLKPMNTRVLCPSFFSSIHFHSQKYSFFLLFSLNFNPLFGPLLCPHTGHLPSNTSVLISLSLNLQRNSFSSSPLLYSEHAGSPWKWWLWLWFRVLEELRNRDYRGSGFYCVYEITGGTIWEIINR